MLYRSFYILLSFFLLFTGCNGATDSESIEEPNEQLEPRLFQMGVSGLIPKNYPNPSDSDWNDLFNRLPDYGDLIGIHTGWNQGQLDDENVPELITLVFTVTDDNDVTPYIVIGFEPDQLPQQQADTYFVEHRQDFMDVCLAIAARFNPEIFLIGIEINRYYEKSTTGFNDFLDVYEEIYHGIKNMNPNILVGSNFLLEYMKGEGARSGTNREEHWFLLNQFQPGIDLATFTLFPFLDFNHPNEIPDNYLSEIQTYTTASVMITETGWPSRPVPNAPGLIGSDQVQLEYLERLLELSDSVPMHSLVWAFQHDPETGMAGGIFDHISMVNNDGSPKPAFQLWQEYLQKPLQ